MCAGLWWHVLFVRPAGHLWQLRNNGRLLLVTPLWRGRHQRLQTQGEHLCSDDASLFFVS